MSLSALERGGGVVSETFKFHDEKGRAMRP